MGACGNVVDGVDGVLAAFEKGGGWCLGLSEEVQGARCDGVDVY